ncbi:MAG: MBL fold metallo-hydrolase [Candidatus Gastranaerophilales bacterium]|nr:MBL fold metallo-hydrolase [Candidatus Gastranaerophilales bacterium]
MSEFKVKFRGVRGSFPVADKNFLKFGGNTSCVEVRVGGHLIILDAGTGIVGVGDDLMQDYIASAVREEERKPIYSTILVSHIHQDHLLGLTFFKPIHLKNAKLKIYGPQSQNSTLESDLSELIFGKTFPIELENIACNLDIKNINDTQAIIIKPGKAPELIDIDNVKQQDDDVLITFYKSYVHPQEGVMIYKISYKGKTLVYATDKECYFGGDKKFVKFAKDSDLLIHDAQYTTEDYLSPYSPKQGFGHSTYDMAVEVMKQTKAKSLVFFHYDPSYDDNKLERIKEHYTSGNKNIHMAYEGLEFDLL